MVVKTTEWFDSSKMTKEAFHAVRAARMSHCQGAYYARAYARNHGCFRLYILALFLQAGGFDNV